MEPSHSRKFGLFVSKMKNKALDPTQIIMANNEVALITSLLALKTLSSLENAMTKSSNCKRRKILKTRKILASSPFKCPVLASTIWIYHGKILIRSTRPKKVVA